ncbi:hypothetical protein [Streptomyces sp. NPDC057909]|uniref:hypothetical protein n=1 Tax=Streptomyces sp. NPDC057909 TaxID=3346277 RepID=UPI0036E8F285
MVCPTPSIFRYIWYVTLLRRSAGSGVRTRTSLALIDAMAERTNLVAGLLNAIQNS